MLNPYLSGIGLSARLSAHFPRVLGSDGDGIEAREVIAPIFHRTKKS